MVRDARNMRGFTHQLGLSDLADETVVQNLVGSYPHKINIRRYGYNWEVSSVCQVISNFDFFTPVCTLSPVVDFIRSYYEYC